MKFAVNYISNNKDKYNGFEFEGSLEDLVNEILSKHREISEILEIVELD